MPRTLKVDAVTHLVVHCSDSMWGDERAISDWHRLRGFDFAGRTYTGYHFVIDNGYRTYAQLKDGTRLDDEDGRVQEARPVCYWGCHAIGYNDRSLGICLIGVHKFTEKQMAALERLCRELMAKYSIPVEHVIGHYETPVERRPGGKTCPNFDVSLFRRILAGNPLDPKKE